MEQASRCCTCAGCYHDLDFCLVLDPDTVTSGLSLPHEEKIKALERVLASLRPREFSLTLISETRVPIVRHRSGAPPLFDLTLNLEGLRNSAFLRAYVSCSPTVLYPMAMVSVLCNSAARRRM